MSSAANGQDGIGLQLENLKLFFKMFFYVATSAKENDVYE